MKKNKGNAAVGLLVVGLIVWGLYTSFNSESETSPSKYNSNSAGAIQPFTRSDDNETERSYKEYEDHDCADFGTQSQAQDFFEENGGPDEDYHNLDRDGDGIACESL
jgi:hypothetical protein